MRYATMALISRAKTVNLGVRTVTRIADVHINLTQAETQNRGRLAIDNELARMKYCV